MRQRKRALADIPPGANDPVSAAINRRDSATLDMVRAAIQHNQTLMAFQPVMQARAPNGTAFYEGLIRVLDETGRVIPAREFMPQVENAELGRALDVCALQHGLRALAQNPDIRVSVNMSARSIGYQKWMAVLNKFLKKDATLGERLILEITEDSAMTVPELVMDFMDSLQDRGVGFALDDFGAGVTAFRYFREFFFDAVKIDGQFIRGIHTNPDNQVLTKALVGIARQFDMFIIAESVEKPEEAAFLTAIGVDCLQGYLYGAPSVRPPWIPDSQIKANA